MQPKPVKDVETFDGRTHEVDIRLTEKTFSAWAFVDTVLVQGDDASTQIRAVLNWKKQYQATFTKPTGIVAA